LLSIRTSGETPETCCIWTPPQLCTPGETCSFGFTVRCIRGHRQKPRPCPACRTRSVTIDRECFTQARTSRLEPGHSVGKEPVGEPSLSGEPECLSLHLSLLSGPAQSGKQDKKGAALPPRSFCTEVSAPKSS
jgi:hypothetical protein